MQKPPVEIKTSDEIKYYGLNWIDHLDADVTITVSEWEITTPLGSPDLEIVSNSIDGKNTLVRLAGGEEGRDYTLVNTITTSSPETLQKAIEVRVRSAAEEAGIL